MAASSPDVANEVVTTLQSTWVGNCCVFASSTLVLYDHATTLSREIEFIWRRQWNSVTLLYYLNRWTTFIWAVEQLTGVFVHLDTLPSCIALNSFNYAIILLLFMSWAAFSGVRMYAISGGSWWLTAVVWVLSIVPVGTNVYINFTATWYKIDNLPIIGEQCIDGTNLSNMENIAFTVSSRACVIAADIVILLVTWLKTYDIYRDTVRSRMKTPLAAMLLKDGTLYFTMLLALNVLSIAGDLSNVFGYTPSFLATPLSSVIITHFLLNLRQIKVTSAHDSLNTSHPSFVRSHGGDQAHSTRSRITRNHLFLDNMGEDLDNDSDELNHDHDIMWSHECTSCNPEDEISDAIQVVPDVDPIVDAPGTSIRGLSHTQNIGETAQHGYIV